MSEPGLVASDVWLRYHRKGPWALSAADVTIPTGSLVALVGANGAGKTTLFRTWLGFERPQRGSVRVLGRDPLTERAAVIQAAAYVAQEPALYRVLSCADHLRLASHQRPGFDVEAAASALELAQVPLAARAGTLSGGQRVQLSLAIARGCGARVLILDEPLANLDPLARRSVMLSLADYARERDATVLVSSHLVSDLEGTFDRLVLMSSGSVVIADTVESIVARARVELTSPELPESDAEVGRFVGRDGRLRRLLMSNDGDGSATLEDVIIALMSRRGP